MIRLEELESAKSSEMTMSGRGGNVDAHCHTDYISPYDICENPHCKQTDLLSLPLPVSTVANTGKSILDRSNRCLEEGEASFHPI